MNSVTFTSSKIPAKKIKHTKLKMTPQMAQDELNRFYYMRSVAKSNARIDGQKKRNLVKLRQLKNKIIQYFTQITEQLKIEIEI